MTHFQWGAEAARGCRTAHSLRALEPVVEGRRREGGVVQRSSASLKGLSLVANADDHQLVAAKKTGATLR